tara:strand:- start:641 stop:874 length:234 start_codon:yes stop_codon:yes gene_type:complete
MEYLIKLDEEQLMSLIEMIEQHRCEGEDEICSNLRTSIKSQFQSQFLKNEEGVTLEVDDMLNDAKKTLGPGYCDNCD